MKKNFSQFQEFAKHFLWVKEFLEILLKSNMDGKACLIFYLIAFWRFDLNLDLQIFIMNFTIQNFSSNRIVFRYENLQLSLDIVQGIVWKLKWKKASKF